LAEPEDGEAEERRGAGSDGHHAEIVRQDGAFERYGAGADV
jgi:hypothetical protein